MFGAWRYNSWNRLSCSSSKSGGGASGLTWSDFGRPGVRWAFSSRIDFTSVCTPVFADACCGGVFAGGPEIIGALVWDGPGVLYWVTSWLTSVCFGAGGLRAFGWDTAALPEAEPSSSALGIGRSSNEGTAGSSRLAGPTTSAGAAWSSSGNSPPSLLSLSILSSANLIWRSPSSNSALVACLRLWLYMLDISAAEPVVWAHNLMNRLARMLLVHFLICALTSPLLTFLSSIAWR